MIDESAVVISGVAIIGVYVWVSSHIANRKRHPDAEQVIYRDYCKKSQQLMEQRHDALEKRADERHEELKALIMNIDRQRG